MTTEELKMVVDMIGSLGANGKEAFIAWLIANYGSNFVTGIVFIVAAGVVVHRLLSVIWDINKPEPKEPKFTHGSTLIAAARDYWLHHPHATHTAETAAYKLYGEVERVVSASNPKESA